MKTTKIYYLFRKIPNGERQQVAEFLACSVFNRRADVLRLYQYLLEQSGKNVQKEDAWKAAHPKKSFHPAQWNLLTSRLFKCIETYLSCQQVMQDETAMKIQLSKSYRRLKMEKNFQTAIKDARKTLDKKNHRHADYLHRRFELEQEYLDYVASHDRTARTNLQESTDALDAYFISSKLKQACFALSRKAINKEVYKIGLLDQIIQHVKETPVLLNEPAVGLYYYCYTAIADGGGEDDFIHLRQAMKTFGHLFPPAEIRDVYLIAINFCIRRLNSGKQDFAKEALEMYRLSLYQGFLLEDGILPESTFGNIVTLSVKVKEYAWAEEFVEMYHSRLRPSFREPLQYYSLGKLRYEQSQLASSMHFLARVDTAVPWLLLAAKTLQIKIYYDLGEIGLLDSLLDSMRVYLQRKDNINHSENYKNMVAFTRQLLSIDTKPNKEKEAFAEKVKAAKVFSEKEWFLEKIQA